MSIVSVAHGHNRYQNVYWSLQLIKNEIQKKIKGKEKIVLKPNFVHVSNQLSATHVEAVKAVLDFLKQFVKNKIIIAEAPYDGKAEEAFENYDYFEELEDYNVKFVDLNLDQTKTIKLEDKKLGLKPINLQIAKTLLESDFIISVTPPKTHDSVITTLTLKNVIVGGIIVPYDPKWKTYYRGLIHETYRQTNIVIYKLAKIFSPQLCVIDSFVGMEGDGPGHGTPVSMNLAIAGLDFLAVDTVGTYLMGFDPNEIGYLSFCREAKLGEGDLEKIKIVGIENLRKYRKKFKPHKDYQEQLSWRFK
jgi:uncharacterized protein (DUF362 family)